MKVHQAVIRLYLKTSKVLSDGSSPILLRVSFNGFKEVSTHYSCDARHWDKKREEVKRGYPNFLMVNYPQAKDLWASDFIADCP